MIERPKTATGAKVRDQESNRKAEPVGSEMLWMRDDERIRISARKLDLFAM
jgi:hypothetical protein